MNWTPEATDRADRLTGLLLGTVVGDSIGLPFEGMTRRRVRRMCPEPLRHRFLFGRGMISDDSEHAFFTAESLLRHPGDSDGFARTLGWKLRWWVLGMPAGVGLATLRASIKLWLGFGPRKSGVWSAGNGPAMRSPIIGAFYGEGAAATREWVLASTRLTHTDPRAATGALAAALAASIASRSDVRRMAPAEFVFEKLRLAAASGDDEWVEIVDRMEAAWERGRTVEQWADELGCAEGVGGYIYRSVPAALYAWLRHWGDFEQTVASVILCGGDTDTTGALAGALAGATLGERGIPKEWIDGIFEWPRGVRAFRKLARRLADANENGGGPVSYFRPGLIARNLFFMIVVLGHGIRRLLPPYG